MQEARSKLLTSYFLGQNLEMTLQKFCGTYSKGEDSGVCEVRISQNKRKPQLLQHPPADCVYIFIFSLEHK